MDLIMNYCRLKNVSSTAAITIQELHWRVVTLLYQLIAACAVALEIESNSKAIVWRLQCVISLSVQYTQIEVYILSTEV